MDNKNKRICVTGGKRLSGSVEIEGSKNSTLACMAGAAIAHKDAVITLNNVPDISDVGVMASLLEMLGKKVTYKNGTITITGELEYHELPRDLCGSIRGSQYILGVMMAGLGKAYLSEPGGDKIGARPIDIHLDNLAVMGAEITESGGVYRAVAPNGLVGKELFLGFPSVGATCNLMLAAARAEGKTTIMNCAKEPEIVDLANLLNEMGVKITGAGSDKITVTGSKPEPKDVVHDIIADRIETGVFITAIAITGGDATIKNCIPYHNHPLISLLTKAGVNIETNDTEIHVQSDGNFAPIKVTTMPYPGVATDLQPLLTIFALKAQGVSTITDLVFPGRFGYTSELRKMGAKIEDGVNSVKVEGGHHLEGNYVTGTDIRAATALVCAGLIAEGQTEVEGMNHIERGYKNFVEKLLGLGADIEIMSKR